MADDGRSFGSRRRSHSGCSPAEIRCGGICGGARLPSAQIEIWLVSRFYLLRYLLDAVVEDLRRLWWFAGIVTLAGGGRSATRD